MPGLKHIHSYVKFQGRKGYWKCADPLCSHYATKEAIVGKMSKCPNCLDTEFILTPEALNKRVRPICMECRNTKEAREFRRAKNLLANVLTSNILSQPKEEMPK